MTDRELLELAAKAAGLWNNTDPSNGMLKVTGQYWNPLTDDGDALRLAVKLLFEIDMGRECIAIRHSSGIKVIEAFNLDPCAATRRAIVRAAAEIGKGIIPPPIESDLPEDNYYKTIAEAEKTT